MSLDLDDRQRAMLKEMGVQVWWPKAPAVVVPKAVEAQLAAAVPPPERVKPAPVEPVSHSIAIQIVANNAHSTRANATFDGVNPAGDVSGLDWPALQSAVAQCRACALCEGRQNTVFGVGQPPLTEGVAPQVDWLIVGEAPGENEDRTGEPFVGQAGQLLDNMLLAMGVSRRNKVYIANVIKCRPPHNRNPDAAEIAQCEPYLFRQIALLQPRMILAMGKFAATTLLQHSLPEAHKLPLGRLRGQVHRYTLGGANIPVVATYHPAYLLRSLTEKAKAWADLCLAMTEMRRLP